MNRKEQMEKAAIEIHGNKKILLNSYKQTDPYWKIWFKLGAEWADNNK